MAAIHPDVRIGHVHLKVADLERALALLSRCARVRADAAIRPGRGVHLRRRLSPPHRAEHLGEPRRLAAAAGHDRPVSPAILYPTRAELADALRRVLAGGHPLDGAADHGVSEALYLRDPDDNGVELYWDRPQAQWPRTADGQLAMFTRRLDLEGLLREGDTALSRPGRVGSGPRDL